MTNETDGDCPIKRHQMMLHLSDKGTYPPPLVGGEIPNWENKTTKQPDTNETELCREAFEAKYGNVEYSTPIMKEMLFEVFLQGYNTRTTKQPDVEAVARAIRNMCELEYRYEDNAPLGGLSLLLCNKIAKAAIAAMNMGEASKEGDEAQGATPTCTTSPASLGSPVKYEDGSYSREYEEQPTTDLWAVVEDGLINSKSQIKTLGTPDDEINNAVIASVNEALTAFQQIKEVVERAQESLEHYSNGLHYTEFFEMPAGIKVTIINDRGEKADEALTALQQLKEKR